MITDYFPFSYTGEIIVFKTEENDCSGIESRVESAMEESSALLSGKKIKSIPLPYLNIRLRTVVGVEHEYDTVRVRFVLNLFELNVILVLGLLISTFLFLNSGILWGVFVALLSVMYYLFSLHSITLRLRKAVSGSDISLDTLQDVFLWKRQQEWIKDKNVCPACGEPVNIYSDTCVNCGLQLSVKKRRHAGSETLTDDSIKINYNVRKE